MKCLAMLIDKETNTCERRTSIFLKYRKRDRHALRDVLSLGVAALRGVCILFGSGWVKLLETRNPRVSMLVTVKVHLSRANWHLYRWREFHEDDLSVFFVFTSEFSQPCWIGKSMKPQKTPNGRTFREIYPLEQLKVKML